MSRRTLRLRAAALLLACAVAVPAFAVEIAPLALPDPGLVGDPALQAGQLRALEAVTKARAAEKAAAAPAAAPGQDAWDVTHYDLALTVAPASHLLTGSVTVTAEVTAGDITELNLDLQSVMAVAAVRVGGLPAPFVHGANVLTVTLDRPYATGETVTVAVDYAGDPSGDYFGWNQYGGQPLVWTLSEPYGSSWWWPCKDQNTDKADSVSLHVTVPDPLVVASNGVLESQDSVGGQTTYHWTTRHPIAPYLVSLAIHPYVKVTDTYATLGGGTMPVENYLIPAWEATGTIGYAVVPDQLAAFAAAFGEYPFVDEKYGHAHFPWPGGMEHQTCASMTYSYYEPWFLAHELGHQWFGDAITCADFHHVWLNEGFATWCEAYWREVSEGPAAYRAEMDAAAYYGPGTVYVADTSDFGLIFDQDLSYNKGSWVVHMLRGVMGDAAFFAGVRQFLAQYGYGAADTEQFQAVMEAASGLDLTAFFQQWVYGEFFPQYLVGWGITPINGGSRVKVRVQQLQTGLFVMPLDLLVHDDQGGTTKFRIQNDQVDQWYTVEIAGVATQVELDPDGWVLCAKYYSGLADADADEAAVPALSRIDAAVPNPFNPRTEIRFATAAAGDVRLEIFDLTGRRVRTLVTGWRAAGPQSAVWDGRDDAGRAGAAGVYLVRLHTADGIDRRAVTLVK